MRDKYYFEREVYSKQEFNFNYDQELIDHILKYKTKGSILDLGCGQGGNSLKLAELGFKVTAIDISETAIRRIQDESINRVVDIQAIVSDIETFPIKKKYDIIILTGSLHFISRHNLIPLLNNLKANTKREGLNIIDTFVGELYNLDNQELIKIYHDFYTLEFNEYIEEDGELMNYAIFQK